jgi:3-dehydroquinate dehydratase-2
VPGRLVPPRAKGPPAPALRIVVVHGPNLNLLGKRKPAIYGATTLAEIDAELSRRGQRRGAAVRSFQSNHEGALIDTLHRARGAADGVLLNPGGLGHTSVALRDAIEASGLPTVEVHLSNIAARESFRQLTLTAPVCVGSVSGFGASSYYAALDALLDLLARADS